MTKTIYILNEDNWEKIFWEKNHNTCFLEKNNKIFFENRRSELKEKIEIQLRVITLELNEQLIQQAKKIYDEALKNAEELSGEPIETYPNSKEEIIGFVKSAMDWIEYDETIKKTIFQFLAKIFFKCLMHHKLINGNKRFSLSFLILMLRNFGYHFYWSKGSKKNYSKYTEDIKNFVEIFSGNSKNDQKNIDQIVKWIDDHVVISVDLTSDKLIKNLEYPSLIFEKSNLLSSTKMIEESADQAFWKSDELPEFKKVFKELAKQ